MARQIELAGYEGDLGEPLPLGRALALAPPRGPAAANPRSGAALLEVDVRTGTVERPPGLCIDGGGLAKGLDHRGTEQGRTSRRLARAVAS